MQHTRKNTSELDTGMTCKFAWSIAVSAVLAAGLTSCLIGKRKKHEYFPPSVIECAVLRKQCSARHSHATIGLA